MAQAEFSPFTWTVIQGIRESRERIMETLWAVAAAARNGSGGGGGRRMRMGTPQSAGLGVLGVLLLWGRVKGDLSWDSWPVQGGRRDWSSLCALSPETYIVPRRAAPSRAGDRSRGAALPASGAGCRVGLSAPSSSSSPAPFQPLFSRYGSPGAAALLFRGDTKPNHCRSCWAQSRRG